MRALLDNVVALSPIFSPAYDSGSLPATVQALTQNRQHLKEHDQR
jgi:hypothetical protein